MEILVNVKWNRRLQILDVDGADICATNFSGREIPGAQFSTEGRRTFGVRVSEEDGKNLFDDGFPVKNLDNPDKYPTLYMNLEYEKSNFPPKVYINDTIINDPDDLVELDNANIDYADIEFHVNKSGKTLYVDKAYFYIKRTRWTERHGGGRKQEREMENFDFDGGFEEDE